MRKITDNKLLTSIFICAGFAAVFTGAVIFFIHLYAARQEIRVEASDTFRLSTIAGIEDKSDIVLCAHRGFSAVAPENTVAAINAAGDAGFTQVEFDVQESADGVFVLMHDKKINRMTDGRGLVSAHTFKVLLSFDIDNGSNYKKFGDIKIPTLSQAMTACSNYGITPVIEMKRISADGVARLADEISAFLPERVIVSSFDKQKLLAFRNTNKDAELWLLSPKLDDEDIKFCLDNPGVVLAFNAEEAEDTIAVKAATEKGIKMSCWVVNDADVLKSYYDCGIRSYMTDCILPLQANQSTS